MSAGQRDPRDVIGESVGPYRILSRLGAGATGEVHLAEDTRLHRHVAIKTLLANANLESSRTDLLREARAAAALSHPSIASVFDVIEADGRMHLVMEFVPGDTLSSTLRNGGLPPPRAMELAHQIASGLAFAHRHGVLHCDLKPGNIVVTPDGTAKILDFGLSRLVGVGAVDVGGEPGSSGFKISGTPPYMAPELFGGARADEQSDVYSLGITMYEMACGRRPYDAPDVLGLARAILTQDPAPLSSLVRGVPPAFEAVIARTMAREPEQRFPSASSVRDALDQALRRESSATTRSIPVASFQQRGLRLVSRSARRGTLAIAMVLLALVIGLLFQLRPTLPRVAVSGAPVVAVVSPNFSDPDNEGLTRGFSDLLTGDLHALPGLVVASTGNRPGDGQNPTDTGRLLGAAFVLIPTGARTDQRVQLSLALKRVDTDQSLWSTQLSGDTAHILTMQKQMSRMAVSTLGQWGLVQGPPSMVSGRRQGMTQNLDAYGEYTQALGFEWRPDVPGNLERAVGLYERALAHDPEFVQARAGLGRVSLALYQSTKSRSWLDRSQRETLEALRLSPESPSSRYAVAVLYAETGQEAIARRELMDVLQRDPENDEAHRLLGRLLAASGDLKGALSHLETARQLRPGYWGNQRAIGLAYYDAGRYAEAIQAFQRFTELQPDSAWGFQTLGTAYHASGDRTRALENYRKAIAIAPSARSFSNIGTLLYEDGRFEEAVDAYKKAINLRPKQAMTHRNLGDALLRMGRTQDAKAAYRTSAALAQEDLEVRPNNPDMLSLEAYCLARLGQLADAIALSARALEQAPTNNAAHYERAVIMTLAGKPCEALAALSGAIEKGYSVALVAADKDLRDLAGHPRFDQIVGTTGRNGRWATVRCE